MNTERRLEVLTAAGCPTGRRTELERFWQRAELNGWESIPAVIADELRGYRRRYELRRHGLTESR